MNQYNEDNQTRSARVKREMSAEIAQDVEAFLANGGVIQELPIICDEELNRITTNFNHKMKQLKKR